MPHSVFQTSQIMTINTQITPTTKTLSSKTLLPPVLTVFRPKIPVKLKGIVVNASTASCPSSWSQGVDADVVAGLERCFRASPVDSAPSSTYAVMYSPVMKGQYGAFGAVTLEKSKLDLSQKQTKSSLELVTGGGGGDIGKKINLGGGDGGDDGGDDDDYFDDFDDGDEGDEGGLFRRRIVLGELFDCKFVDAVLMLC